VVKETLKPYERVETPTPKNVQAAAVENTATANKIESNNFAQTVTILSALANNTAPTGTTAAEKSVPTLLKLAEQDVVKILASKDITVEKILPALKNLEQAKDSTTDPVKKAEIEAVQGRLKEIVKDPENLPKKIEPSNPCGPGPCKCSHDAATGVEKINAALKSIGNGQDTYRINKEGDVVITRADDKGKPSEIVITQAELEQRIQSADDAARRYAEANTRTKDDDDAFFKGIAEGLKNKETEDIKPPKLCDHFDGCGHGSGGKDVSQPDVIINIMEHTTVMEATIDATELDINTLVADDITQSLGDDFADFGDLDELPSLSPAPKLTM